MRSVAAAGALRAVNRRIDAEVAVLAAIAFPDGRLKVFLFRGGRLPTSQFAPPIVAEGLAGLMLQIIFADHVIDQVRQLIHIDAGAEGQGELQSARDTAAEKYVKTLAFPSSLFTRTPLSPMSAVW